jgi:hypothetical protein
MFTSPPEVETIDIGPDYEVPAYAMGAMTVGGTGEEGEVRSVAKYAAQIPPTGFEDWSVEMQVDYMKTLELEAREVTANVNSQWALESPETENGFFSGHYMMKT